VFQQAEAPARAARRCPLEKKNASAPVRGRLPYTWPCRVECQFFACEDLKMTVIICVAGAVVGLFIGIVSGWLVLPTVLRTWDSRPQDFVRLPLPFAPTDVRELKALITFIYRYVIPLVFASVGGIAAYYLSR
jgi:hypothetical protein